MIELEHSPLGGSAAKRFLNCSASFLLHREQLEDGIFERFENEFADRGTGAHELGATCLSDGSEPYEHLGKEFYGYKAGWPEGIELDAVSIYVDHCRRLIERLPQDGRERYVIERTYRAPHVHRLLKGTVDFASWHEEIGVDIVDYKNGEGVGVNPVANDQGMYYAFLLILNHLLDWPWDTPVRIWVVQPNYYGLFEEAVPWETTIGAIMKWGEETLVPRMVDLDRERDVTRADFKLGDHCQFCPVLLDCILMQEAFSTYARMGDEEFVMMLSDKELADYYAMREPAMRFKTELEKVVYARKVTGAEIPTAKLVMKKTARVFKPGAEGAAKAKFGAKAMVPGKLKSPAELEKISSDAKAFTLEWAFKPNDGQMTIAPLSDPRMEVTGKNAALYAKYETKAGAPANLEDF